MIDLKDKTIPINFLLEKSKSLVNDLSEKMLEAADTEAYEKAAYFKKSINSINDRIMWMNQSNKTEITLMEYDIHLAIGSVSE